MKFAIYYIPPPGDFYDRGTRLIGYDIRNEQESRPPPVWFQRKWAQETREYGFHLTITDAVDIEPDALPEIEEELRSVLSCFSPEKTYLLEAGTRPASFWPTDKTQAALMFQPNALVLVLHTALVTLIQSRGRGSLYQEKMHARLPGYDAIRAQKIKLFLNPYIFDDFVPHFSLVRPYDGTNHSQLESQLNDFFRDCPRQIEIKSLCLVLQQRPTDFFKIHREIDLVT